MALWAAAIVAASLGGWMHQPLAPRGDLELFRRAATAHAEEAQTGNAAIALLADGRVRSEEMLSVGEPVDASTIFQMASVSKWVTSWGVMVLVEQGAIDLDIPVSRYLARWELPESEFDNEGVTVRRLLSHTAGLTDGLGYMGFEPGRPVQGLVGSLSDTGDPVEGASGKVRVGQKPGSQWMYSGGGYTILQLLIEEVSGEPFSSFMQRKVLDPLGMTDSSFVLEKSRRARLATFYDPQLDPAPHYRYTALAAASLYSTSRDGVRFLQAHLPGAKGEPIGRGVLQPETVLQMQVPQARKFGRSIWGLGCVLYAENGQGGYVIGHDGNNRPAINHTWRLNPATGNGIVVMSSGNETFASRLGGEWTFWETGNVDIVALALGARRMVVTIVVGWMVMLATALALGWIRRSSARR
jgi:CubicO group peptidase (beta-lactamase class C family)